MKLIIINNKGGFSTVLNAFLSNTKKAFDEIYVLFPKTFDINNYRKVENVYLLKCGLWNYLRGGLNTFFDLFSKESCVDYYLAIKQKKFNFLFLKQYIKMLLKANTLYYQARFIIKKEKNICILSMWYSDNAVAAAKIKKEFPNIMSMSYAHSYEIDFRKNKYVLLLRDRFKEQYLDKILFISSNVMNEYIENNRKYLKNLVKYEALHFGSEKKKNSMAKASNDGAFRIATCSGISKVKRLDLLIDALKLYSMNTKIIWTHMGSGELENEIRKKVEEIQDKENIKVCFMGRVTNDKVHEYYATQYVDLFLNISESEGLPVSIMEAMSYGIPVLATNVGGNSEIVNENTGYLVEASISAFELNQVLENIINNLNILQNKRENAYEKWFYEYKIDNNVKKVVDIFYERN